MVHGVEVLANVIVVIFAVDLAVYCTVPVCQTVTMYATLQHEVALFYGTIWPTYCFSTTEPV